MLFIAFQTLVDTLHKEVGDGNVKLGTQVLSLACSCDGLPASDGWSISVNSKDASSKELAKNQSFDAVIMKVRNAHLYFSQSLFDMQSGKFASLLFCKI